MKYKKLTYKEQIERTDIFFNLLKEAKEYDKDGFFTNIESFKYIFLIKEVINNNEYEKHMLYKYRFKNILFKKDLFYEDMINFKEEFINIIKDYYK